MADEFDSGTDMIRTLPTRHGTLAYFANDSGAASRSLVTYGEWAANEISFLAQFIQPGAVVLDVGAYIGTHTLAFARCVGPDGHVIAFEAQPETFTLLSRNVAANQLANVRLENMAVGETSGFIDIPMLDPTRPESFGSMSLLPSAEARQARMGQVRLGSIDGLCLSKCDVIKIDAEGMEAAIISGAAETIRRLQPVIYAECNSIADGLRTLDQFKSLDYAVRLHVVDAYPADNFLGAREDIFGGAREAALVGMHRSQSGARLDAITPRSCELLLRVDTADDLALGLLNKPQYVPEVLVHGAAAESGGRAWIDGISAITIGREKAEHEADWAKATLAEERTLRAETEAQIAWVRDTVVAERDRLDQIHDSLASAIRNMHERLDQERAALWSAMDELRGRVIQADRNFAQHNADMANQLALFESAMRQAQFARDLADAAVLDANAARRAREGAVTLSEEATRHAEALAARLRHTETMLNAVYGSTSWRLTSPLRWLVQRLRGRT